VEKLKSRPGACGPLEDAGGVMTKLSVMDSPLVEAVVVPVEPVVVVVPVDVPVVVVVDEADVLLIVMLPEQSEFTV
jgi:hypothetical protein